MNRLATFILRAHGILFRNRNTGKVYSDQSVHIAKLVESISYEAAERETSMARVLYMRLPDGAANEVQRHWFDPYYLRLNTNALAHWLESHVLFNEDGRIVVLHDYGVILWKETNNG